MAHNGPVVKDDKQLRRQLERKRARRLGVSQHMRSMHESYEDLGYYFMMMIMSICESLIKGVEKKTGMLNMYDSHKKEQKKPYLPHQAPHPKDAPKMGQSKKHKKNLGM